jgi:hypothetical protein
MTYDPSSSVWESGENSCWGVEFFGDLAMTLGGLYTCLTVE